MIRSRHAEIHRSGRDTQAVRRRRRMTQIVAAAAATVTRASAGIHTDAANDKTGNPPRMASSGPAQHTA
jgi:hypothetical protein